MTEMTFESIRREDEEGNEYWFARELAPLLDYVQWRNFSAVIKKAIIACEASENDARFHFFNVNKKVDLGLGNNGA